MDGGAIAILNLAEAMADKGHEVRILAMNTPKHQIDIKDIPPDLSSKIDFTYVMVDTKIRFLKLLMNLIFSKQPYNAIRFDNKEYAFKLKEVLKNKQFDIIQLEGLYLKPYLKLIRSLHKGKLVYRAHNIESDIWEGIAESQSNPVKKRYLKVLATRLRKYEQDFMDQYDILLPISKNDLSGFRKMGNTKDTHLTYTGIPDDSFRKIEKSSPASSLFFIGALDWIPNQEGLIWFFKEVWKPLKSSIPALKLHIAGRNAPDWLAQRCLEEGAVFHGEVPDAHQFLDEHDIMIVPLFAGSGLRIKIIEAMSRSRAIITTPAGAKGLPDLLGRELIINEHAEGWIDQIRRLLGNEKTYLALCTGAYNYAKQNFSNDSIVTNLLYFYRQQGLC